MKRGLRTAAIAVVVAGLVLAQAGAAHATSVFGDKYCSSGYDAFTSTVSGSGSVTHQHSNRSNGDFAVKSFVNSGTQTRYWSAGFEDIFFYLNSASLSSYGSSCLT